MPEPNYLVRARSAIERLQKGEVVKVYSHVYPDLDSLCSIFLLRIVKKNLRLEFVSVPFYGVEKLPADAIAIDILGGELDHHDIQGKHWSTCKIIYYILFSTGEITDEYATLTDYCHRADMGGLKDGEKDQGSLIHTMYGLRGYLEPLELYDVFEVLASACLKNVPILYSMSDITAASINPKYSDILASENVEKPELIRKYVRFVEFGKPNRSQSYMVAINTSNHNIISILFEYYRNLVAVIYCSENGRSGIVIRRDSPMVFDLAAIRDTLINERKESSWFLHTNKKMLLCGSKKMEISSKIPAEDLVELLYKHRV